VHVAEAPGLIEARDLTKRFGDKVAVDHLSFDVEPGRVTGFLGPNGAGKSTTMRLITGLDRPDGGSATIGGLAYDQLAKPLTRVGALLEARSLHPGRSARNHLLFLAQTQGVPASRAESGARTKTERSELCWMNSSVEQLAISVPRPITTR
jgi:ABC-2 type transport system ATP-binding protein